MGADVSDAQDQAGTRPCVHSPAQAGPAHARPAGAKEQRFQVRVTDGRQSAAPEWPEPRVWPQTSVSIGRSREHSQLPLWHDARPGGEGYVMSRRHVLSGIHASGDFCVHNVGRSRILVYLWGRPSIPLHPGAAMTGLHDNRIAVEPPGLPRRVVSLLRVGSHDFAGPPVSPHPEYQAPPRLGLVESDVVLLAKVFPALLAWPPRPELRYHVRWTDIASEKSRDRMRGTYRRISAEASRIGPYCPVAGREVDPDLLAWLVSSGSLSYGRVRKIAQGYALPDLPME